MKSFSKLLAPMLSVLLGVLLVAKQGEVISIALTVLGAVFVILGIIDIVKKKDNKIGIIRIVIGALIIAFGWLLLSVALYVIAVFLAVIGIASLFKLIKAKKKFDINYLQPIMLTIAGICLFFNQGSAVAWVFIVVGVALIVHGVLGLVRVASK